MKKLILILTLVTATVWGASAQWCGTSEVSAEEVEAWVEENRERIAVMDRADWLKIDNSDFARAAFIEFSPEQKQLFWLDKITEVMTLEWTEPERDHLRELSAHIAGNIKVFSNDDREEAMAELEDFVFKWSAKAADDFGWNGYIVHKIISDGYVLTEEEKKHWLSLGEE